jgi:SAM-dependent methyltransferase
MDPAKWKEAQAQERVPKLSTARFVDLAYQLILGRDPDMVGFHEHVVQIESKQMSRDRFISILVNSPEFKQNRQHKGLIDALHGARLQLVKQLPKADVIVDLGGSCRGRAEGALVIMGYPYSFQRLSIVELPREQRHELYETHCEDYQEVVSTQRGPVNYVFASMTDLSAFADDTIDLVYAGQSIEHVTADEAQVVCREVRRILKPGGFFCLDTPNRAITRLQCPNRFINPDHKIEYTHAEMVQMLEGSGLVIRDAKGLCLTPESVPQDKFLIEECRRHEGLFDDIENCYLMYYKCQKVKN